MIQQKHSLPKVKKTVKILIGVIHSPSLDVIHDPSLDSETPTNSLS